MTVHCHGTPLTPRSELVRMAGKHFCVSFADPRDGDWCDAVLRWFCADTAIEQLPPNHIITLPPYEKLL